MSLSARRAWIEIAVLELIPLSDPSLSARRAWIEMIDNLTQGVFNLVALRKESVDRNYIIKITRTAPRVALRKESVDRNSENPVICIDKIPSLSARRAWIEMIMETPWRYLI